MKSLIIVALLFSSCFASSLYEQLSAGVSKTSKRADAITCQDANYQCVNVGGSCSAGCPDCVSALIDCQVNAENQTALCACATTFVNCYAAAKDATCDSSAYHDSCLAQLSNCSCGTPYTGALTGYTCYSNAYCTDNGKCASVKGVGSACNSSSECGDVNANPAWTYDYTCENNVCQKSSKNMPGDPCSSNSDCEFYSGYSLGCVSGTCASQAVDKECPTSDHQVYCGPNLYCDDADTCQKVIAVGSFCDGNSTSSTLESMCGILASCDTQQNKCVKYLSLSKGQTCTFDGECGAGLYCSQNKSTCQDVLPEITCTSDDDCTKANPDYQGCSCQGTKAVCGVPGSQQCVDEALSLYTCIDNNNCPEEFIPGGCVENNCKKEYDCYYKCFSGVLADIYGTSCLANYVNTCDSPSFAAKNVVAWGVVVLAAVAAML